MYDFPVQTAQEHISKQQGQQPQSSVRTEHEAQLLLLCIFIEMWQNFQCYAIVAFRYLKHYNTPVMQAK